MGWFWFYLFLAKGSELIWQNFDSLADKQRLHQVSFQLSCTQSILYLSQAAPLRLQSTSEWRGGDHDPFQLVWDWDTSILLVSTLMVPSGGRDSGRVVLRPQSNFACSLRRGLGHALARFLFFRSLAISSLFRLLDFA